MNNGEKINECVGANGGRIGGWLKDDDKELLWLLWENWGVKHFGYMSLQSEWHCLEIISWEVCKIINIQCLKNNNNFTKEEMNMSHKTVTKHL